mmetsp:Transcript_12918/g.30638  ORF Transcript_12918/g.30638 Transcript_12918/m.30638 type:complete len:89 (+) Transcript_12918:50-316(+)
MSNLSIRVAAEERENVAEREKVVVEEREKAAERAAEGVAEEVGGRMMIVTAAIKIVVIYWEDTRITRRGDPLGTLEGDLRIGAEEEIH